jgi:hypothetical protein
MSGARVRAPAYRFSFFPSSIVTKDEKTHASANAPQEAGNSQHNA